MQSRSYFRSINPATEELMGSFEQHSVSVVDHGLSQARRAFRVWHDTSIAERARLMALAASRLRKQRERFASLITMEMGKPIVEAEAEIEKCAWNCDYFAARAEEFLAPEIQPTNAESFVQFPPLGVLLAIMPWNYPFWQVFRFAAPALMAGNVVILKHAPNVPQCALAIETLFRECGFPDYVFQAFFVDTPTTGRLIDDARVEAVALTGSDRAGSEVGTLAGRALKKTVLELGGSDPFVVLEDADLDAAVAAAVKARFQNAGQSCIAAKRFIIAAPIFDDFTERFMDAVTALRIGDPLDRSTRVGPLARADLRETVELQVNRSLRQGARVLTGGGRQDRPGYFYQPTVMTDVAAEMPVCAEEVFGPVAPLMEVRNEQEAVEMANRSVYGLGASLWTRDLERGRRLASGLESGLVFVNGTVASDPRLPFGGIKRSGHGRELSKYGIREFVNVQTVWMASAD